MKKSDIAEMPIYYDRYIACVDDVHLSEAFSSSLADLDTLDMERWLAVGEKIYAPNKWTIMDILQHLIDWERIFTYRALLTLRGQTTLLTGFDEDEMAKNSNARQRSLADLLSEFKAVRQSSIAFFNALTPSDFAKIIRVDEKEISVLAMAFIIIGHQIHHFQVIEALYLPLA